MSESTDPAGRELEDDHDLLTFNEAGARLHEEIARLEQQAQEAGSPEQAGALSARAEALRTAATRNDRTAAAQPGATGFLTYQPPTRP
jgi:hypothetical protein